VASSGSEPELAAVGEEEEEAVAQLTSLVQAASLREDRAEVDSVAGLKAELKKELELEQSEDSSASNSHVSCYLYVLFFRWLGRQRKPGSVEIFLYF